MYKLVIRRQWLLFVGIVFACLILIVLLPAREPDKVVKLSLTLLLFGELIAAGALAALCYPDASPGQLIKIAASFEAATMFLGAVGNFFSPVTQLLPGADIAISWIQLGLMNVGGIVVMAVYRLQADSEFAGMFARSAVLRAGKTKTTGAYPAQPVAEDFGAAAASTALPASNEAPIITKPVALQTISPESSVAQSPAATPVSLTPGTAPASGKESMDSGGRSVPAVKKIPSNSYSRLQAQGKNAQTFAKLQALSATAKQSTNESRANDSALGLKSVLDRLDEEAVWAPATPTQGKTEPLPSPPIGQNKPVPPGASFETTTLNKEVSILPADKATTKGFTKEGVTAGETTTVRNPSLNTTASQAPAKAPLVGNTGGTQANSVAGNTAVKPGLTNPASAGSAAAKAGFTSTPIAGTPAVKPGFTSTPIAGTPAVKPGFSNTPMASSTPVRPGFANKPIAGNTVAKQGIGNDPAAASTKENQGPASNEILGDTGVNKPLAKNVFAGNTAIGQGNTASAASNKPSGADILAKSVSSAGSNLPQIDSEKSSASSVLFEGGVDAEMDQAFANLVSPDAQRGVQSKSPNSVFTGLVNTEVDKLFSNLAPVEAQKEVTQSQDKLAKTVEPAAHMEISQELSHSPQAFVTSEQAQGSQTGLLGNSVNSEIDQIFANLAPPAAQQDVASRQVVSTPGADDKNTAAFIGHSDGNVLEASPQDELPILNPLTKNREVKEFGRLSAKSAVPEVEGASVGTMKTIGKLLIDVQMVENIIKAGETGHIGSNMSTARIISEERGTGIRVLLEAIGECEEVTGCLIVGHDGLVIASTLDAELDKDTLGALSTAVLNTSNLATLKLDVGKLTQMVLFTHNSDTSYATIFTDVEVGILVVLLDFNRLDRLDQLLEEINSMIQD